MSSAPPLLLIGNPENRRVQLFTDAARALGQPPPHVLSHAELLESTASLEALLDESLLVRLEAVGENLAVERALLRLGYAAAQSEGVSCISPAQLDALPERRGQIICPAQHHLGFLRYLDRLDRVLVERPGWISLQPLRQVRELFDKRRCWRRYHEMGIAVPEAIPGVGEVSQLRREVQQRGWSSVYVKLASGSSASCLAVYRQHRGGSESVMTTIERTSEGWFNSLRVRRVDSRAGIEQLLGFLLREGAHVERAIPKARLNGAFMDCRVLVIDGEPLFTVVRQNRHPITNLHLGGWRGEVEALRRAAPPLVLGEAYEECGRVWAAHGCLHLGIDVLFEPRFSGHRVLEANAFGDLLPGLSHEGMSVYQCEINAALRRYGTGRFSS